MNVPLLWYFADPMCSWCWGFSPVIEAVRNRYHERLKIALVLGGLRPGTTTPMTAAARDDILHHWQQVHARSGQPFQFDGALPDGFIYDTEPASRAVVTAGGLDPSKIFAMFQAIQTAFYAEGRDVTQPAVLAELAAGLGMDAAAFQQAFDSEAARARTQAHFAQSRKAGVRGFPTLILQRGEQLDRITDGWQPLDAVQAELDRLLLCPG
ncbi:DsbA family protein [Thiobacillus sp.]|uniref:DsbA family protein n=1 Tax=Thiobacillus sp. TaxID=924 RepID=UPI0025EC35E6|nr:DsbA family protein [Thiobacillus sp.]MBT9539812.1 DsbA family protein [Thiobacillus sp.]